MAQQRRPGGGRLAGFFSGMAGAGADLLQESRVRQQQKLDQAERLLQQLQLAAIENPEALQALKSMAGAQPFPEPLEQAIGAMAAKTEAERVEERTYRRKQDAQEQRNKQNELGLKEMGLNKPPRPQAKTVTRQGQIIDPGAATATDIPGFKAGPPPVGRETFAEWQRKEDYRQRADAKKRAEDVVADIAKSKGVQTAAVAQMELTALWRLFNTSAITAEDYTNRVQATINKFMKPATAGAGAAPFNPPRMTTPVGAGSAPRVTRVK